MAKYDIPKKMKAVQVVEFNKPYKVREVDVPSPDALADKDLLVKVAVASFCHTDMMVQEGIMENEKTTLPRTASHEGSGTVVAVGKGVKNFKPGDRVMCGIFYHLCGTCSHCVGPENFKQYCQHAEGGIGVWSDGAFADYVVCDAELAAKIPDEVTFETAAPLACAGITVFRGILQADLKAGEWLGIVGSGGGLGHLGIHFAKAFGLKVIGVDARDEGIRLTEEALGNEPGTQLHGVAVDARAKDHVEQVRKITGGEGVAATVNVSDAKTAAATACAITRMHGKMIQLAQPEQVSIPFHELVFRDIRVQGSLVSSPAEAQRMLDVVAKHQITVKSNIFKGLDSIHELVELAHGGKMQGKAMIAVDQKQLDEQAKLAGEQA